MTTSNPTLQLQLHKPFFTGIPIARWYDHLKRVNVVWFLIRFPLVALALPAAYGVAQFASEYLPAPWSGIAGAAFESAYIGAIALADQQLEDTITRVLGIEINTSKVLWWLINIFAVLCSVLSNLLFVAGGKYGNITPEIATHALPMPILGFFYSLLLHNYSSRLAARLRAESEAERKELNSKPYQCDYCTARYASVKQRNGHMARCQARLSKT